MMSSQKKKWQNYLQEEVDAAFLYKILADRTDSERDRAIYLKLNAVEQQHAAAWKKLLEHDHYDYTTRPSLRARGMASFAKIAGVGWLKNVMLRTEGDEVKTYLQLYKQSGDRRTRDIAITLAKDSAGHAESLNALSGSEGEPWHQTNSGGIVRNVVYGFNDGLTANFGLIAGVIGAQVSGHFVLISGIAGLIADALSMGASGYLAAKSEREVYDHELEMEADEIALMPELEKEELSLIYQSKGMTVEDAARLAEEVMKDPKKALEEQAHDELGISESGISPFKEAWLTGIATAVGAFIPVFPFFFWSGSLAIWTSVVLAMIAHFAVGSARSFFTGQNIWKSGWEMFVVGMGVAVVGYFIGGWITG